MQLLIIGGTVFLGRALVEAAQAQGHTVTLFNRGRSRPGLDLGVEQIHGDRTTDLNLLAGRQWDAVIDTCGYVPRVVRASAHVLANSTEHYTFISSISVYASTHQPGLDEQAPVGTLADPHTEQVTGETYGPLKALCEQAVEAELPGRTLVVRPGLIVGPHDPTDRFSYWPLRVARGGRVLAPGRPERRDQYIDVRDLAEWTIRLVEQRKTGTYNATGPEQPMPMGDLLSVAQQVSGSDAEITWVAEPFLQAQGVQPWSELPLWLPESDPNTAGFSAISIAKATSDGLRFQPLASTVADTLAWAKSWPADREWRAGISPEREAALLAAWDAQQQ